MNCSLYPRAMVRSSHSFGWIDSQLERWRCRVPTMRGGGDVATVSSIERGGDVTFSFIVSIPLCDTLMCRSGGRLVFTASLSAAAILSRAGAILVMVRVGVLCDALMRGPGGRLVLAASLSAAAILSHVGTILIMVCAGAILRSSCGGMLMSAFPCAVTEREAAVTAGGDVVIV